jgi:ribosome-associated protein
MKKNDLKRQVSEAIAACQEKQAGEITILELDQGSGAFTDYFVVCSGTNVEGYKQAEWVLLDYVNFVVHVFSEKARKFYDLERLWKSAKRLEPSELGKTKRTAARSTARKRA